VTLIERNLTKEIADEATSLNNLLVRLKSPTNQRYRAILKELLSIKGWRDDLQNGYKAKRYQHLRKVKICPVCSKEFQTVVGTAKEKSVCSKSCSNTYFRSRTKHPNWVLGKSCYRSICFETYPHKCLVCNEQNIVEVHHLNSNRLDNTPSNLIPLCPTHHKYIHSKKFKELISEQIAQEISRHSTAESYPDCRHI